MNRIFYLLALSFFALLSSCRNNGYYQNENDTQDSITAVIVDTIIPRGERIGIKMHKKGGVYEIPCIVNGLKMNFIFDTGASNVCISLTEALFMYKNGYITDDDLGEKSYSKVADGSIVANMQLNLKTIEIEGLVLNNVDAVVVASMEAPLLLGQSAIQQIGKIEIDGDSLFIRRTRPMQVSTKQPIPISLSSPPKVTWWEKVKAFCGDETKILELLEASEIAYENDLIDLADKYCQQAKELDKNNWKPYAYSCYMQYSYSEKYDKSYLSTLIECLEAVERNKKRETFYFHNGDSVSFMDCKILLARVYAKAKWAGDLSNILTESGEEYLQNLVIEQPNNITVVRSLVQFYTACAHWNNKDESQFDIAEKWAKKLFLLDEEAGYFQLALIEQERGNLEKAIGLYENVLKKNPKSPSAMNNLANVLLNRNHTDWKWGKEGPYCVYSDYSRAVELKQKSAKLGCRKAQKWLKENKE